MYHMFLRVLVGWEVLVSWFWLFGWWVWDTGECLLWCVVWCCLWGAWKK